MNKKEKVTEEKFYKVIRKKGNHPNNKVNEDGSRAALQFTENNNMDGPLDIIEVTDDEVIRRGKELSQEGRTWKQIVWEEIIAPISKQTTEQLLRIGYRHFEVWMEEKALPVAKEKSKMLVQNTRNIFSDVKAAFVGEEPKALRLKKEVSVFQENKQLIGECDSALEKEVEKSGHENILMSVQEIEEITVQAKQSAEILVACINLLRNTVVSDTDLTEDQRLNLQNQLESLATTDIFRKIDLLLEEKNKNILDPRSLQIIKAFRNEKFIINGKEVPIRNYIE